MSTPNKIIECPICLNPMSKPIIQCINGHSIDQKCIQANSITHCPQCRGNMTEIRCIQLEQLIDSIGDAALPCPFESRGCNTMVKMAHMAIHENHCRYRNFACEGNTFAGWNCDWIGDTSGLYEHFQEKHPNKAFVMMTSLGIHDSVQISLKENNKDLLMISYNNGHSQNYFYLKYNVDIVKQKVFWLIQLVGPKWLAKDYYYEFEIQIGSIKKFKVTEFCESAFIIVNDIIEKEKCVTVPFASLQNFLNEDGAVTYTCKLFTVNYKRFRPDNGSDHPWNEARRIKRTPITF